MLFHLYHLSLLVIINESLNHLIDNPIPSKVELRDDGDYTDNCGQIVKKVNGEYLLLKLILTFIIESKRRKVKI